VRSPTPPGPSPTPGAIVSIEDVTHTSRGLLRGQRNAHFRLASAVGVDLDRRELARGRLARVLELDSALRGTHPAPPLPWQRYPRVDGYIHPWTSSGRLRPGLRFKGNQRGRCFLAEESARSAVSCLYPDGGRNDACFPQRRPWQRGDLAACSFGPGSTTFTRWVISQGSDPPIFVPWSRIGDISLGGYEDEVQAEYGSESRYGRRDSFLDSLLPGEGSWV
jgi:hypothetical protein